jgi:flagellar biogenesis protein FliO
MNLEVIEMANLLCILAIAIVAIWLAVQIMRGRI